MSKQRSDAKLSKLTDAQRAELISWFDRENISLADAKARLEERFSLGCSESALSNWWSGVQTDRSQAQLLERIGQAARSAESVTRHFEANPQDFYQATMGLLGQMAFSAAMEGRHAEPETLFELARLQLAAKDRELKEIQLGLDTRKVQLLEKKAAQADEAKGAMENGKLSPQERDAKLKEIFGIA